MGEKRKSQREEKLAGQAKPYMRYYSSNIYKICLPPLLFLQSVVYETPNINRCFLIENNDTAVLKTEGVNLQVSDRPMHR